MRCPRCGSEEDGRYCRRCGADLSDPFIQWDYGSPSSSPPYPPVQEKKHGGCCLISAIVMIGFIVFVIVAALAFGMYLLDNDSDPSKQVFNNKEYIDSLSGEGTDITKDEDKEYVENIDVILDDPDSFAGKYVIFSGRVSFARETDNLYICDIEFDPDSDNEEVYLEIPKNITSEPISSYDYLNIEAKINGAYKTKYVSEEDPPQPSLTATAVKQTTYIGAFSKSITTWKFSDNIISQNGVSISVDKVEFAEDETRIFLTATNHSSEEIYLEVYITDLYQNGQKCETKSVYALRDCPEPETNIPVGKSSSGILCYERTEPTRLQFTIKCHSDDPDVDFTPFVFELSQPE